MIKHYLRFPLFVVGFTFLLPYGQLFAQAFGDISSAANSHQADAQAVLNAVHSGQAQILGYSSQGHLVVRVPSVTGTNVNIGAGQLAQPTNTFLIKGTGKVSVFPVSPTYKP